MLNSKEVREYELDRAVIGGYEARGVEAFLEEVADTLELLETENADLRGKVSRCMEQIDQYRRSDSEFRETLIKAHSFADGIRDKAEAEAEKLRADSAKQAEYTLESTRKKCREIIEQYRAQALSEQKKLEQAQRQSAAFIKEMSRAFREQSDLLTELAETHDFGIAQKKTTVRADTMQSRVVKPMESELHDIPKAAQMPEDLQKLFAATAAYPNAQSSGYEEREFTVELSGSAHD